MTDETRQSPTQTVSHTYSDTTTEPTEHTRQSAGNDHSVLSDAQLAYRLVMADRNSLDLIGVQYEARNRILKLSAQLWDLRQLNTSHQPETK